MKKTLKTTLTMGLALVMLMCTCLSTTAFAVGENAVPALTDEEITAVTPRDTALDTVIFSSAYYNGNPLPTSASKSISFNRTATKALISVLPLVAGQTGRVNVTIAPTSASWWGRTVTVTVGTDYWVDLEAWGIDGRNFTVSYSGATIRLIHLGVTFGY